MLLPTAPIVILTLLMTLHSAPIHAAATIEPAQAEQWLAHLDTRNYAKSWDGMSAYLHHAVTPEQWEQAIRTNRNPIGILLSRVKTKSQFLQQIPGLPAGEYAVFQFDSVFSDTASAIETVIFVQEPDKQWRVIGYTIK